MPNLPISDLIPPYPLHWTSIVHYLMLLGAIAMLTTAGDKASVIFTIVLAIMAIMIGASLYAPLLPIGQSGRIFLLLIRVVMFGVPVVMAGMGAEEQTRSLGVVMAILALPILLSIFFTCWTGSGIGDPRVAGWCG